LSRIYCDIDDVKRLLRSLRNRESKIRFSDSYRDLKADDSSRGTVSLTGVSFVDSFAEHETYTFEFSDSTSFSVVGDVVGSVGSGNILTEFTATGRFTVPAANWSGLAEDGDKWYITAASDISNDDGHAFIVDATRRINAKLERHYGSLSNVSFYDSTSVDLPDAIEFSCIRYTAHDIFHSVYAGIMPEGETLVESWKSSAEETLEQYLLGHGRGPIWRSRESKIIEIGVEGIDDGILDIDELTDNKNKEYER
jgi:hypothetical protein